MKRIIKYREWCILIWGIAVIGLTVLTLAYADPIETRAAGNVYYVDNTHVDCDDAYTTGENDIDHPWCTIGRANSAHTAGDTVMIKGEYREELIPKAGVDAAQPTVYSGYSTDYGQTIIVGSDEIDPASWSLYSGSIYRAQFDAPTQCRYDGNDIYSVNNTNCWIDRSSWLLRADPTVQEDTLDDLDEAGEYWYDESTDYLYVWMPDSDNPASHTIECSQRPIVRVGEYSAHPSVYHFELRNMTLMQSNGRALTFSPYEDDPGNITIENNEIAFTTGDSYCLGNPAAIYNGSATGAAYLPNTPGYVIKDNLIHDAGSDRGPSYGDWRFEAAHLGAGIEWYGVMDSLIEGNEFYNMAQPIALKRGDIDITVKNNVIHDAREGIWLGWPTATGQFAGTIEGNIFFNIVSRTDQKASGYAIFNGCGDNRYVVYHNTIVDTSGLHVTTEADAQGGCNLDEAYLTAKNNIISNLVPTYTSPQGTRFISLYWNSFSNAVSNHNLFYHPSSPTAFAMRTAGNRASALTTYATLGAWQTASSQDVDSFESDPLFIDAGSRNYQLQSGSPGIDEGEIIAGYHCPQSDDVDPDQTGCRHWQGSAPDLGAVERTDAAVDITAPVISDVSVGSIGQAVATVTWTTDEQADTQVEYGLTAAYGSSTGLDSVLTTSHSRVLSGLTPGTMYHYRVRSRDGSDNLATSSDGTFTTLSCTESWSCGSWSACASGSQSRTCTDANSCGTSAHRPSTTRSCTSTVPTDEAPHTRLLSYPRSAVKSSIVTITWTGSDDSTPTSQLRYSYRLDSGSWSVWSTQTSVTLRTLSNGAHTVYVRARDRAGNIDASAALVSFRVQVDTYIVTAPNNGGGPQVRVFDRHGAVVGQFFAYDSALRSGISVAAGDLGGDGHDEIITAPGPGSPPLVRVFRRNGSLLNEFYAFDEGFRGGVSLAVGDFDGNGEGEIVVSPMGGGGPQVRVFGYRDGAFVPLVRSFWAYDERFRGGISLATCDIEGDGIDEVVTGPARAGGPQLRIFGIRNREFMPVTLGLMAYDPAYRGGITVACGDVNGDGLDEIVTGTVAGGPHVRVFGRTQNGVIGVIHPGFIVFLPQFRGGVSVATGNIDYDRADEILVGVRSQSSPLVRIYSISNFNFIRKEFYAYSPVFQGGIFMTTMH